MSRVAGVDARPCRAAGLEADGSIRRLGGSAEGKKQHPGKCPRLRQQHIVVDVALFVARYLVLLSLNMLGAYNIRATVGGEGRKLTLSFQ